MIFKDATKIQNGPQRSTPKFFKVLLKFKMAAMDELHNNLWAQKLKN